MAADSSPAQDWPSPLAIQLAAEIRRWRQAADFSEAHLAGVIGFTRQYISFAERPRRGLPSAAAITFGATLDQPVGTIISVAEQPQVPTRVRPGDVRHVHNAVTVLEDWDMRAGGGTVRPHALAALRWATALRQASCTPAVRLKLEAAVALLADMAGWVTFDCGDYPAARELLLLGLHAARESGDLGIRGSITMHLALQEIHTGNWIGGLELTQLASTAAEAFTPNMMARLHTVNALGYARKQDAAQCHRSIESATNTYQPDSLVNDPSWLQYFTPAILEQELIKARYDLALGDAEVSERTADRLVVIERLSTVFTQLPPERARNKTSTATRLATLLYQEGEHRAAQQMAEETISLAEHIDSARLAADLQVLLQTMPADTGRDEEDLHHRLSAVLTEMT